MQHPIYPNIELKPSLALFDYDQTYDMVYIPPVNTYLIDALFNISNANINVIGELLRGIVLLFDRYFPENYPIPVDYSAKLYSAFLPYANTGFLFNNTVKYPNGTLIELVNYNVENKRRFVSNWLNGLAFVGLYDNNLWQQYYSNYLDSFENNLVINYQVQWQDLPNNYRYIDIPNFPSSDEEIYLIYCIQDDSSDAPIPNRSYAFPKHIVPSSTTTRTYRLICQQENNVIEPCSLIAYRRKKVVNSTVVWEEATDVLDAIDALTLGLTYRNLDDLLDLFIAEIKINFSFINKGIKSTLNSNVNYTITPVIDNYQEWSTIIPSFFSPYSNINQIKNIYETIQVEIVPLPEWMQRSCFRTANNNAWLNTHRDTSYIDHGDDFFIKVLERNDDGNVTKFKPMLYKEAVNPLQVMAWNNIDIKPSFSATIPIIGPDWAIYLQSANTNSFTQTLQEFAYEMNEDYGKTPYEGINNYSSNFCYNNIFTLTQYFTVNGDLRTNQNDWFFTQVSPAFWQPLPSNRWVRDFLYKNNFSVPYAYVFDMQDGDNAVIPPTAAPTGFTQNLGIGIFAQKINFTLPNLREENINNNVFFVLEFNNYDIINEYYDFNLVELNYIWELYVSAELGAPYAWGIDNLSDIAIYSSPLSYNYTNQEIFYSFNTEEPVYLWDNSTEYCNFEELLLMPDSIRIKEIHACLGAGEYAYYLDQNNEGQPAYMNIARRLDLLAKAWGIAFKLDGSIISNRQRKNIPYQDGNAIVPNGWIRGQFGLNQGDNLPHNPNDYSGQNGGFLQEERLGIVYQNRSNTYDQDQVGAGNSFFVNNPDKFIQQGDLVLCENLCQFFEAYFDDLDKGLNWQESGTGLLPNLENPASFLKFEGLTTLVAEIAYMISSLSKGIQESHLLNLQTKAILIDILKKGLGVPIVPKRIPLRVGKDSVGDDIWGSVEFPGIAEDASSLTRQNFWILENIGSILASGLINIDFAKSMEEEAIARNQINKNSKYRSVTKNQEGFIEIDGKLIKIDGSVPPKSNPMFLSQDEKPAKSYMQLENGTTVVIEEF